MYFQFNGQVKINLNIFLDYFCIDPAKCSKKIKDLPKNIFTLHGLWPSYGNGKQIAECNTGEKIKIKIEDVDLNNKMNIWWVSYTKSNVDFWTHEYNKHGYCYNYRYNFVDPNVFFKYAIDVFAKYQLHETMRKAVDEKPGEQAYDTLELINNFKRILGPLKFRLDCGFTKGKQYLQEIRFYFDLDLTPIEPIHYSSDCKTDKPIYVVFQ